MKFRILSSFDFGNLLEWKGKFLKSVNKIITQANTSTIYSKTLKKTVPGNNIWEDKIVKENWKFRYILLWRG